MYFPSLPALRYTCSRGREYFCDSVSVVVVSAKWKAVIQAVQRSAVCLDRSECRELIQNVASAFQLLLVAEQHNI
ncbi:hypothetical protein E2C01_075068 [Portunus trituberculatus]|uniref:Uncharacterized protein n=1 Tax=Portunus trituberculatus TaxID=210409 RepID=A0A5B7II56_PORTR|nr:hypothetical protein [Portunus trituberculatus]